MCLALNDLLLTCGKNTRETNHDLVAVRNPCEEDDRKTLLLLITSRGITGRHHFCSEELV